MYLFPPHLNPMVELAVFVLRKIFRDSCFLFVLKAHLTYSMRSEL